MSSTRTTKDNYKQPSSRPPLNIVSNSKQAIKAVITKHNTATSKLEDEQREHAFRQIVSKAIASDGVVDIFAVAGLKNPNIGLLSDEFLNDVRLLPQKIWPLSFWNDC